MREEDAGKSCLRINNGQPLKVMRAQKPMIGQTVDHLVDWEELRTCITYIHLFYQLYTYNYSIIYIHIHMNVSIIY